MSHEHPYAIAVDGTDVTLRRLDDVRETVFDLDMARVKAVADMQPGAGRLLDVTGAEVGEITGKIRNVLGRGACPFHAGQRWILHAEGRRWRAGKGLPGPEAPCPGQEDSVPFNRRGRTSSAASWKNATLTSAHGRVRRDPPTNWSRWEGPC